MKTVKLDTFIAKVGHIDTQSVLERSCKLVEDRAKELCPVDTGSLRDSITHEVNGNIGEVYTTLPYATWVERGTGIFAANGDGRKEVYWVFVKNSDGSVTEQEKHAYTLQEAKQYVAILRSKGLDAYYTQGIHPQPYLEPALEQSKEDIIAIIKDEFIKQLGGL